MDWERAGSLARGAAGGVDAGGGCAGALGCRGRALEVVACWERGARADGFDDRREAWWRAIELVMSLLR